MSRPAEGLARRRGLADGAHLRQCLRRLRRVAARLHAGLSVLGGAAVLPQARHRDAGAAQGRRHWSRCTGRPTAWRDWPTMRVFAFDHRMQLEEMADDAGADHARIGAFKTLCLRGRRALSPTGGRATASSATAGSGGTRFIEAAGHGPVDRAPGRIAGLAAACAGAGNRPGLRRALVEWPLEHVVKVLCFYHPDDDAAMKASAGRQRSSGCSQPRGATGWSFCWRSFPPRSARSTIDTTARVIQRFYDIGVYPDWWKLEPMKTDAPGPNACAAITSNDPHTRGIVVLGLDAPADELEASFRRLPRHSTGQGLRGRPHDLRRRGRGLAGGKMTDEEAVERWQKAIGAPCATLGRSAERASGREEAA